MDDPTAHDGKTCSRSPVEGGRDGIRNQVNAVFWPSGHAGGRGSSARLPRSAIGSSVLRFYRRGNLGASSTFRLGWSRPSFWIRQIVVVRDARSESDTDAEVDAERRLIPGGRSQESKKAVPRRPAVMSLSSPCESQRALQEAFYNFFSYTHL